MKLKILLLFTTAIIISCKSGNKVYNDGSITYAPLQLTEAEKQTIRQSIERQSERFDPEGKMITSVLNGWNYHTDAQSGTFHNVRGSFTYAVALLDLGDPQYRQRAFDVIGKVISLQDTDPGSKSYGVWPYYEEEPLATKKSPIDYNWADFNAVSLLDIYMYHRDILPSDLSKKIKEALILAAGAVKKRDVKMDYTNIAVMGAYVTYMVSHLFDIPDLKEYANDRLKKFYNHTLAKNGFSEYNSPTYTITALNELDRMRQHIVQPDARQIIDALYAVGWEIIATHYHKPTGQWAGPHSRSYSTLLSPSVYRFLNHASNGKIMSDHKDNYDVKSTHQIPEHLLPYFLSPVYPRVQQNVFENTEPRITGFCYLTDYYALSTASLSSMWNQRRPFLAYWGTPEKPSCLQVRMLKDYYDLATAVWYSEQKNNTVLAAINFATDGGDKHLYLDAFTTGRFPAKDLRLRFEFGNTAIDQLMLPVKNDAPVCFEIDGLQFNICLFHSVFSQYKGYWEKGGDDKIAWLDFVLYAGEETEINLTDIDHAALGFTFRLAAAGESGPKEKVQYTVKDGVLDAGWIGLKVSIPVKPDKKPKHYNLEHPLI